MRNAATRISLALLVAALAAACGSTTPADAPASDTGADPLDGTSWTLMSIDDQAVPATDTDLTLDFAAGTASGSSGCNTFSGSYTIDGTSLSFGPMAVTQKACEPEVSAVETDYLTALQGVTAWAIPADAAMGTELSLIGDGAKLVFEGSAGG